jgi:hypothetical protein
MGIKQQVASAATDVAKDVGREGIAAIEREALRRREDACAEVVLLEVRLIRLPRWRLLARAITHGRLARSRDRCKAIHAIEAKPS